MCHSGSWSLGAVIMKTPQTKSKIEVPAHLLVEDRQLPLFPHMGERRELPGRVSPMGHQSQYEAPPKTPPPPGGPTS